MQSVSRSSLILLHFFAYGSLWVLIGQPFAIEALVFSSLLIWISIIDIECFEIPDQASLLLVVTGMIRLFQIPAPAIVDAVSGAVFWPFMFWAVAYAFKQRRGFDGLGFGDVKLMVGIGLWCGFMNTISVVLAASVGGIVVLSVAYFCTSSAEKPLIKTMVAFGPFLCLSAWAVWLSGITV